jgi:hypothetical protein
MDRCKSHLHGAYLCLLFCKHIELLVLCASGPQFKTVVIFHIVRNTVVCEFRLGGIKIPSLHSAIILSVPKLGLQPSQLRSSQCCLSICHSLSVDAVSFDHPSNVRFTEDRHGTWRIKTNGELNNLIRNKNVVNYIKAQRLNWFGLVHRMAKDRMVSTLREWKPISKD